MNGFAQQIEQIIYHVAGILIYPVLLAAIVCLVWALVEVGRLAHEYYRRVRYRDLRALEARTLRARAAFARGSAAEAYRELSQHTYSLVVSGFVREFIENHRTARLPQKPMKLLQEYEFDSLRRLEKTRILVRVGPMLGLMGTLIPLSPALTALAQGDTATLAAKLKLAFSATVLGLLIGGLGFVVSAIRDRTTAQDISDMEYMLELLEGADEGVTPGSRAGEGVSNDLRLAEPSSVVAPTSLMVNEEGA
jgi:biopolymer transport protein ExbB/TolQ